MSGYNLSLSDLLFVDGFKEAYAVGDVSQFLHNNGMDVVKPYEMISVQHRNLRNMVVTCPLYVGEERLDDEWIKGGAASLEAQIEACKDAGKRHQLRVYAKGGNDLPSNKLHGD